MSLSRRKNLLAFSVLSLSACAQQTSLHQIQSEIKSLNQDMLMLSQQAVTLSRQNKLNAQSTQGVYLLPSAGAPALLDSQIGRLKMSLTAIIPTAGGTQVTLLIQENTLQQLPAFSATIEWKDSADETHAELDIINDRHSFIIPVPLATSGRATIRFILPDVTPKTLRWVRIHHITPTIEATRSPVDTSPAKSNPQRLNNYIANE